MSEDNHTALAAGTMVADFRIERVLGSGGFGITYLALDTALDRRVAVKEYLPADLAARVDGTTVKPRTSGHADTYGWGLARFLDEARTLARFDHPHIVRVLRVLEANGTAYMVMSHEVGTSLDDIAAAGRLRTQAAVSALLTPLLDGLERVHEAGFVHRDIKPHNVIIRADGAPVLIDFGSARQAIGAETRTLTTLVSEGYAPFEQYNEDGIRDAQGPWTDIYGLAATLYRCITGKKPPSALARAHTLLGGKPDPLLPAAQTAPAGFQPAFLAALDHGLRFSAEDRPRTVAEWRAEFDGASDDGGTVRRQPPPSAQPARRERRPADTATGRRRTGILAAAVLVVAALASAGWWSARQLTAPTPQTIGTAAREAEVRRLAEQSAAEEAARLAAAEATATAAASRAPGVVFRDRLADDSEGPEMVVVPAGSFTMGSPASESGGGERQHGVSIGQFAIGRYEVTFDEYDRFARATGRTLPDERGWGRGRQPAMNVDWDDASAYATWLTQQTGGRYRLPTEAEWEYAARAGTTTAYSWGDSVGYGNANCDGCGSRWDNRQTVPVGSFRANAFGLFDMHGNVWEWTCSAYDSAYGGSEQRCSSGGGGRRVYRGGSWLSTPTGARSAYRLAVTPDFRNVGLGFRLAQDL